MSRWLPSVLCNKSFGCLSARRLFFLQLFGIVFWIHGVIFVTYGIVGWMQSGKERFKISLTQSGATYVLMPFQKMVDQKNIGNSVQNAYKKSNVIDQATYERKKNRTKKKALAAPARKSVAKNKKSLSSTKIAVQKKEQASVFMKMESKKVIKSKLVKAVPAEVVLVKTVTQIQEVVQAAEPISEKKAVEELKVEPVQEVQQTSEMVAPANDVLQELKQEVDDDDFDENNVIFVGYEEIDKSIIGSKIQHSIQQIWTPPVGMQKNISCEVYVKVGADGQALQAKVTKSSGVFVYDACARKTLLAIEYPKEVCGKSITIILGST